MLSSKKGTSRAQVFHRSWQKHVDMVSYHDKRAQRKWVSPCLTRDMAHDGWNIKESSSTFQNKICFSRSNLSSPKQTPRPLTTASGRGSDTCSVNHFLVQEPNASSYFRVFSNTVLLSVSLLYSICSWSTMVLNIKWKIPELNKSQILNCALSQMTLQNLRLSCLGYWSLFCQCICSQRVEQSPWSLEEMI